MRYYDLDGGTLNVLGQREHLLARAVNRFTLRLGYQTCITLAHPVPPGT